MLGRDCAAFSLGTGDAVHRAGGGRQWLRNRGPGADLDWVSDHQVPAGACEERVDRWGDIIDNLED